jgi:transcriptional regulator of heat shock response
MVLTTRRQKVLMALVDEYVESATPVGSSRIARQYLTEVSPATIRNELMNLETEGYALSPHTSAGRIPTNTGYRMFVNTLLLRGRFEGAQESRFMGSMGAQEDDSSSLSPSLSSALSPTLDPRRLRNLDRDQYVDRLLTLLSEATGLLSVLWSIRPEPGVHHRGMPQLLAQPEFQDAHALIPLMQLIEDETALTNLFMSVLHGNGFMVKIGIEDEEGCLSSYSMVAEAYGEGQPQGALAIFGPTRMDYRKVIPAVVFAARLLGHPRAWIFDR